MRRQLGTGRKVTEKNLQYAVVLIRRSLLGKAVLTMFTIEILLKLMNGTNYLCPIMHELFQWAMCAIIRMEYIMVTMSNLSMNFFPRKMARTCHANVCFCVCYVFFIMSCVSSPAVVIISN